MNGKTAQAIKEAEKGDPDKLLALAVKANTPLAQNILADAIAEHGEQTAEWHAEYSSIELNAHQW